MGSDDSETMVTSKRRRRWPVFLAGAALIVGILLWRVTKDSDPPPALWTMDDIPQAPATEDNGHAFLRAPPSISNGGETFPMISEATSQLNHALEHLPGAANGMDETTSPSFQWLKSRPQLLRKIRDDLSYKRARFCQQAFAKPNMAFDCHPFEGKSAKRCPRRVYGQCHDWMIGLGLTETLEADEDVTAGPTVKTALLLLKTDAQMIATSIGAADQDDALRRATDTLGLVAYAIHANTNLGSTARQQLGDALTALPLTSRSNELATMAGYLRIMSIVETPKDNLESLPWTYRQNQTRWIVHDAYESRDKNGTPVYPPTLTTGTVWWLNNYAGKLLIQMWDWEGRDPAPFAAITRRVELNDRIRNGLIEKLRAQSPTR